jgi:dTDP-4-dehydrorhamnose reductase
VKTLVFGPRSYLAQHFLASLPGVSASEADIADPAAVAAELDREKPDVVINCAGKTGRPNIDWCETHKEETVRGNVTGPLVLLEECGKRGIYWVHLSSGCIYEGDNGGRGFAETDEPNFHGSFYSRSKIWSDQILREFPTGPEGKGGVLILRLRMPFGNELHPRSLISKIAKYSPKLQIILKIKFNLASSLSSAAEIKAIQSSSASVKIFPMNIKPVIC